MPLATRCQPLLLGISAESRPLRLTATPIEHARGWNGGRPWQILALPLDAEDVAILTGETSLAVHEAAAMSVVIRDARSAVPTRGLLAFFDDGSTYRPRRLRFANRDGCEGNLTHALSRLLNMFRPQIGREVLIEAQLTTDHGQLSGG